MGSRSLLLGCLVVCLVLISVYSIEVLNTMEDLKGIEGFGKSSPRAGLLLLCWLLGQGEIDNNGKLRLNFNPKDGSYGSHYYGDFEKTFPDLTNTGLAYYALGNLNSEETRNQLPDFISRDFEAYKRNPLRNLDRVVIRVLKSNPTVVDEVYITQHFQDRNRGSGYDINLTYRISTELLKLIQEWCHPDYSKNKIRDKEDPDDQRFLRIKTKFPENPPLYFLYTTGYNTDLQSKQHSRSSYQRSYKHSEYQGLSLVMEQTETGRVRIAWCGIPADMLKDQLRVGIYENEHEGTPLMEYPLDGKACGTMDTPLTPTLDLQLRLLKGVDIFEDTDEGVEEAASFFTWSKLIYTIVVLVIIRIIAANMPQQETAPHFVRVSHGRPG